MKKLKNQVYTLRDISWLDFNNRVLNEGINPTKGDSITRTAKFFEIYKNNLDEFFMVRVGALLHKRFLVPNKTDELTKKTWDDQLKEILNTVRKDNKNLENVLITSFDKLYKDLKKNKVVFHSESDGQYKVKNIRLLGLKIKGFNPVSKKTITQIFSENKHLLSSIIINPQKNPSIFLDGGKIYVVAQFDSKNLGIVDISRLPDSYVLYEEKTATLNICPIEEIVRKNLKNIFKGFKIIDSAIIRVTRNADIYLDSDICKNNEELEKKMKDLLKKRKKLSIVHLQYRYGNQKFVEQIRESLKVKRDLVFKSNIPLNTDFFAHTVEIIEKQDDLSVCVRRSAPVKYCNFSIFTPYDDFDIIVDLLNEAATDPTVVCIYITLYRLAQGSRIVSALINAAQNGKAVHCIIEHRARFDEENNIDYGKFLRENGCIVSYGPPNYKIHAKLISISRVDGTGEVQYYTVIGTGNFNETTAKQYTDIYYGISDKNIGSSVFDALENLGQGWLPDSKTIDTLRDPSLCNILFSPRDFKPFILDRLFREAEKGTEGFVCIKINSLNDPEVINSLMKCIQKGCEVRLMVRGICCLKKSLCKLYPNLKIISYVGDYLEHSRIYIFGKSLTEEIYIGSGDLLTRNLERRVEAFVKINDTNIQGYIKKLLDESVFTSIEDYQEYCRVQLNS